MFSKYTSWYFTIFHLGTFRFSRIGRYPELRELELRQLARTLLSSDFDPTLELLKVKIKHYTHGQLPHAEDILPALYELMESGELVKEEPVVATVSPDQQVAGGNWEALKKALTDSLTSGTFLDSQFYAVESWSSIGSPKIRPIYFCSTVGGSLAPKLVACESLTWIMCGRVADPPSQIPRNLRHRECHPLGVQMGMTVTLRTKILTWRAPQSATRVRSGSLIRLRTIAMNSVYSPQHPGEPYSCEHTNGAYTSAEFGGGKDVSDRTLCQHVWLTPRYSWSAIILYVYTGRIAFATLRSQDVTPSEKGAQGGRPRGEKKPPPDVSVPPPGVVVTEPCSPKSIYCLANKVRLTPLLSDCGYQ